MTRILEEPKFRAFVGAAALTVMLASTTVFAASDALGADTPAFIASAVSDAARPAADKARDADRKPGEMLAFFQIKPGQKVAELLPGGGYFTRILSKAVGPNGKVYVLGPPGGVTNVPGVVGILRTRMLALSRHRPPVSTCRSRWMWSGRR